MFRGWVNDFAAFLAHMGECPEGYTLDRIDTNGNYEPGNCRWATQKTQNRNKRSNKRIHDGRCLVEVAEDMGMNYHRFYYLFVTKGLDLETILAGHATPVAA